MNIKMNKLKTLSVVFFTTIASIQAQEISQALNEIDAEKFENAKNTLKSIIKSNADEGKAHFLLGNIYLNQQVLDSAKYAFQSGLKSKVNASFNQIGLGQLDLNANNVAAAKSKFELAKANMKKKDVDELIYIAKAYMNATKPDYKAALQTLALVNEKSKQDPLVLLTLGDAYYGDGNQNEAYAAYRDAYAADPNLLRAKIQLGVLNKGAKAYKEAVAEYDAVIAKNPNYGPVYRELAETYYYWGSNVPGRYDEYMKKGLEYYEKYMTLTDYSMNSRMRHADFLILANDYKALEVEANKMKELDKVNPRILRYLGYSAYQNGNYDTAIKSLNDFINGGTNKVIAQDYVYLGLASIKKGSAADGTPTDASLFDAGVANIKKGMDISAFASSDIGTLGQDLYKLKKYKEAAAILELKTLNKESSSFANDNFYLAYALYFANTQDGATPDAVSLQKADTAFGNVITAWPTTQDSYYFRAKVQSLLDNDEMMIKYFQQYLDVVAAKGAEEADKPNTIAKKVESYNYMGAGYIRLLDNEKATEFFNKALAIDPSNEYAQSSLDAIK
jgi:tetratricopeptide (TPR) repeat protein